MIDKRTLFEIHRLHDEGFSLEKIAHRLKVSRPTVRKYLLGDALARRTRPRTRKSKLDAFKCEIDRLLDLDPHASAVVIHQRLVDKGFQGGITILKEYLLKLRPTKQKAFIRFESAPGEQIQIDWGHFGTLTYGDDRRKLYAFVMVEAYSRMLYVEFTHSQNQAALHSCLLNGFRFFGGTSKELVFDNMATAVIERAGRLIRFNDAFLEFLTPFKITPRACNPGSPHEKGKIEKGGIHYVRHNFWPLRAFTDLESVLTQAGPWRDDTANTRLHATTGERPIERFQAVTLRPLPEFLPDCRETLSVKVHSDFSISFDTNHYTVPPYFIGKELTLKADQFHVSLYHNDKRVAAHPRCWQRKKRIELTAHREAAHKGKLEKFHSDEVAAFLSLGEEAKIYLERLAENKLPLKKNITKFLQLKDEYGVLSLIEAIRRATRHNAYGADYIENILYQEMTPIKNHLPVKLKDETLNRIRLEEPILAEYDSFILKKIGA